MEVWVFDKETSRRTLHAVTLHFPTLVGGSDIMAHAGQRVPLTVVLGFPFMHSVYVQKFTSVIVQLFLQLMASPGKSTSPVTLASPGCLQISVIVV